MEERRNKIEPIWIIRWINPYGLKCKSGSREEVEKYAKKKASETGNTYVIN